MSGESLWTDKEWLETESDKKQKSWALRFEDTEFSHSGPQGAAVDPEDTPIQLQKNIKPRYTW